MPITNEIIDKMIDRAADMGEEFWVKVEERERANKAGTQPTMRP